MKRRDATCETVILDLSCVTIKFICEKPLSASAELTGIVSSTPQSNLPFKARGIFFGLLQTHGNMLSFLLLEHGTDCKAEIILLLY